MFDSNQLNKALRGHDVEKVVATLSENGLQDPGEARKFTTVLRQSSCLAIQIEDKLIEQRREQLVVKCRELLAQCPDAAVKQDFEDHVADAKIVEYGYRELFRIMHGSEIWKHTIPEQAWGIIRRAEGEFAHLRSEIEKELARLAASGNPSLDPRQLKIPAENGTSVRPDAVVTGIVKNTGDTLIALAYAHKWFEKDTGTVIIPAEVKIDDAIIAKAGTFSLAASQWRALEKAWDRSRLFKTRIRLRRQEFPIEGGGFRLCYVLEGDPAVNSELMDRIAMQRLEQAFFQSQKGLEWKGWVKADAVVVPQTPLAKAGYISDAERVAVEVLDGHFHLPIDDESVIFAELAFKVWVRGYAHYSGLAHDAQGKPFYNCQRFSKEVLVNGLMLSGLSQEQAEIFISLTTFGRSTADLFDAPLLKVSDGSYIFFAAAYQTPVLGNIVLSRISSLNRRRDDQGEAANDSVFDKGKVFEKRVLQLFEDAGIPAHGFKYNIDGTDYDCDAAVLIDETLFVFECKNRSLPMGHMPSIYYFNRTMDDAKERQAKRIVQQFADHPELIRNQFGQTAKWDRIVPVLLNAMPWSFGRSDGVFIYDGSALSHMLRKGITSVIAEYPIGNHRLLRRHRYPLRKGKIPTAKELEHEMENPNQLRLHALGWKQVVPPVQISEDLVFALPEWSQRIASLEEQMIALGSSPEEAAKIAKEMDEEVPKGVQKIRDRIDSKPSTMKVGRNAPCPCGSGKKFKKCCG
jgi:hypothetical protein